MESILKNGYENMPRMDYPRPMWVRNEWYNLNGEWEFEFDFSASGEERKMYTDGEFSRKITVPFCPESELSGIGYKDFIPAVWYRKKIDISLPEGQRAILHFGAVDPESKVWVNGKLCGAHTGGYTAFEFDITDALCDGENTIVVMAKDNVRSYNQLYGKQSTRLESHDCSYTRTTGIWQTVWLEFVSDIYLVSSKMEPHAKDGALDIIFNGSSKHMDDYYVKVTAFYNGKTVGTAASHFGGDVAFVRVVVDEVHLWDVLAPELYDLKIELFKDSEDIAKDVIYSYFALRDVSFNEKGLTVNGKPVFMRLILDQGYNPEGIYTAPNTEYLEKDIDLAISLGFNGARLHQRVFEEHTLYYADKMGYIVWAEAPSGIDLSTPEGTELFLPEWMEIINSHYNHPAVVGWCPHNETYHNMTVHRPTHITVYNITKALDPYRPCIDASGGIHCATDMFDVHDYEQDPEKFKQYFVPMLDNPNIVHHPKDRFPKSMPYHRESYYGQPYWVSEYGGTFWNPAIEKTGGNAWGYGNAPKTEEEFIARYEGLTDVLVSHPRICGFCYTQLTDIEQEQNGLFYYDRSGKFSDESYARIRAINLKRAAIETE